MAGLLGTSLTTDEMWDTLKSIGRGVNLGGTSGLLGGPVDLATMLLNNPGMLHPGLLGTRGLGIENPVGGSKWIEQKLQPKGLLPKRQGNWQETAGELASAFVNPATAAAVAGPKLYAMESKIAQNAAAPTTLNKQTGAIVWHGSPHKFDKFDSSKIGTGEGAQAYGHGLYLAESPDVARSYQSALSAQRGFAYKGKTGLTRAEVQDIVNAEVGGKYLDGVSRGSGVADSVIDDMMLGAQRKPGQLPRQYKAGSERAALYEKLKGEIQHADQGALYKVDLPDEHIAKMLDWDKPLSKQHPDVKAALGKHGIDVTDFGYDAKVAKAEANAKAAWEKYATNPTDDAYRNFLNADQQQKQLWNSRASDMTGSKAYEQLGSGQIDASQMLRNAGVPGIRYLDGGSRGTGTGTSNFVVFPGNEDLLKILEMNGQPMGGLLGR